MNPLRKRAPSAWAYALATGKLKTAIDEGNIPFVMPLTPGLKPGELAHMTQQVNYALNFADPNGQCPFTLRLSPEKDSLILNHRRTDSHRIRLSTPVSRAGWALVEGEPQSPEQSPEPSSPSLESIISSLKE